MKILLVSSSSSGSGGGGLFFHKLARCFLERGQYVSIAYSDDNQFDGLAKQASDLGCEVIRFPYIRVYDRRFRSLELLFGGITKGISKKFVDSYDVVHVSQQNIEDGIDLVAAFGKICPERLVVTIHIVERLQQLGQRLGYFRQIYSARVYHHLQNKVKFAFVSASAEQLFTEMFGTRLRYGRVIYNGAENPSTSLTTAMVRESLGIGTNVFVLGSLGRLEEQKNYKLLIRAFAEISPVINNSRLVLVGDGSQHNELIELANTLGVGDRLTITGWVSEPGNFLSIMDVFVLPSWFEGFPFALVEALMGDKICLASSIPPHAECLSQENTLLFNPENSFELADALKRVESGDINTLKSAKKVINNAHARFSMDGMINGMIDFYQFEFDSIF